jgi:hypothetical protein
MNPAHTSLLAGTAIVAVAKWLLAAYAGEPYEIFDPAERCGYRLTCERIPYEDPVALG